MSGWYSISVNYIKTIITTIRTKTDRNVDGIFPYIGWCCPIPGTVGAVITSRKNYRTITNPNRQGFVEFVLITTLSDMQGGAGAG